MLGFDLDTTTITADEHRAVATLALAAWCRHEPMPAATPLQRAASRATIRAYCDYQLRAMRAHVR